MPDSEAAGYSADEYGQYEVADNDIQQSAGDGDEGIMRNAMGLRHALGHPRRDRRHRGPAQLAARADRRGDGRAPPGRRAHGGQRVGAARSSASAGARPSDVTARVRAAQGARGPRPQRAGVLRRRRQRGARARGRRRPAAVRLPADAPRRPPSTARSSTCSASAPGVGRRRVRPDGPGGRARDPAAARRARPAARRRGRAPRVLLASPDVSDRLRIDVDRGRARQRSS